MAQFPYSPAPARIKAFFPKIQQVGMPPKVTGEWLASVGFKSTNDRYLIPILKSIGFLDAGGVPTDKWKGYRRKQVGASVLAAALRTTYKDLFTMYKDACAKGDQALRDYFSAQTTVGARTQKLMVRTFKALCELADFEAVPPEVPVERPTAVPVAGAVVPSTDMPTVNVIIQLTLPATDDRAVYDNLFAALKKHLLS